MNSDKRAQSRMARSAYLTDLTSTDGSYDEIRSAPSLLRKEHSGDHNTVSKFAEAMSNPDWRRRRDSYSAYDSMATTSSNTDWYAIGSSESFQPHTDKDAGAHSKNRKPCPWHFIDSTDHWRSSLDSSEVGSRDMSVPPISKDQPSMDRYNMYTVVNKNSGYDAHGLCILIKDSEIIDAPKDVRLLQLVPLSSGEDNSRGSGQVTMEDGKAYPVAHIQPIRGRLPRWKASGEATNERFPTRYNSSPRRSSEARYKTPRSSGAETIDRARKAIFQDPAVANIGNRIGESQEKTAALPSFVSGNPGTEHELSRRNEAFRRILKKLKGAPTNRSEMLVTERLNKETEQRNEEFKRLLKKLRHESGPETRHPGATPREEHYQPELSEKPCKVLQQRKDTGCDPGIVSAYTDYSKKKEWSQDSGVCMDRDLLNSVLNPRAREFLSFKSFARESTSSEDPSISPGQEFFQQIGLDRSSEESERLVNQSTEVDSASLHHHLPPTRSNCFNTSQEGNTNSEASSIPVEGQSSAGLNLTPDMLPFSNVPFPFGGYQNPMHSITSPELLSNLGLMTPIGKWPTITGFGNQLNLPTANLPFQSCAVAPNPLMGVNATPQLPYNPMLGSSGYSTCPPPVSKPILPDPIQQQRYEAYIEWRKANEPGYALACKSRQQRRAQRGTAPSNPTLGKVANNKVQPV
ncbi:hypothetical protein FSPOR_11918 [Fusarium sporotrichioides]|uniref:Uncharacterized protein n=1 Tax=Fusarium sporotrichioides TaxID=5514 RepID=A0A395RDI8_FUSSP|nr:hypothetical protein FSPOR_11918 [Fusarium sporotrichioides]